MNAAPEVIRERLPVWRAFSEFFLDTELDDEAIARIAGVLALSPYDDEELWNILRHEVYPACHPNLLSVAGEWAAFDDRWLMERVAPRCDRRPRFSWPCLHRWLFRDHWEKVRYRLAEIRGSKPGSAGGGSTNDQLP